MRQVLVFSLAFVAILAVAHGKKHSHVASEQVNNPVSSPGVNATFPKAVQRCRCLNTIPLTTFGYEQIVIDNAGSACIGGCGGTDFLFREMGSFVQSINVWFGCGVPNNGIKGIQLTLRNGRSRTMGSPCGSPRSFTFNPGESLTGNLVLCGNGIGTRTGYISFSTNLGRSFTAGTMRTPYNYPVEGRFLTGAFGGSGADIDRLGFIFSKRITGSVLQDLTYPTLGSLTSGLSPVLLKTDSSCNKSPVDQSKSIKFTVTEGDDRCWSAEVSMSLEISYSVTAGVPTVAQATSGVKWTVGAKAGYNKCTRSTRAVENQYNLVTPANHRCQVTITQFDSKLNNLPFSGRLLLWFHDGSQFSMTTSGSFSGAYISQSVQNTRCNPLGASETCNSPPSNGTDDEFVKEALAVKVDADPMPTCAGELLEGGYNTQKDCKYSGGKCCSTEIGGFGFALETDSFHCGYCYTGSPQVQEQKLPNNTRDDDDDDDDSAVNDDDDDDDDNSAPVNDDDDDDDDDN